MRGERVVDNQYPGSESEPDGGDTADELVVRKQQAELREFIRSLTADEVKSGDWFPKLLQHSLNSYTEKVDWEYFQNKYPGVPADAVVDQRIKMAARYAGIAGALSASAYNGALFGIPASGGVTLTAAAVTALADLAALTRLQLHLAFDIAVLYRVPLDTSDPDDLWKLIRVALLIRGNGVAQEGALKMVPPVLRHLIKRYYRGPVLAAGRGLPVVGRHLLQRNVIKIGVPLLGVPLAAIVNRYTTLVAGRHAQSVFRNEARVMEVAETLSRRSRHPRPLLWVAWLLVTADRKMTNDDVLLMRHLVRFVREHHQIADEQLQGVIDVDPDDVWRLIESEPGPVHDILDAAPRIAGINGTTSKNKRALLAELLSRYADRDGPQ